jgi:hypothetical protein
VTMYGHLLILARHLAACLPCFYDCNLNCLLSYLVQIVNWLKHSPTEMEGYIRPGCLVLSMYLSMPAIAWDEVSLTLNWTL